MSLGFSLCSLVGRPRNTWLDVLVEAVVEEVVLQVRRLKKVWALKLRTLALADPVDDPGVLLVSGKRYHQVEQLPNLESQQGCALLAEWYEVADSQP